VPATHVAQAVAPVPAAASDPSPPPFIQVGTIQHGEAPNPVTPLWFSYVPVEDFRLRVGSAALDSCLESMEQPWETCRVTLDACTKAEVKPGYVVLQTDIASCATVSVSDWVVIDSEGILRPLPIAAQLQSSPPAASP
jgi:hypothetical protein